MAAQVIDGLDATLAELFLRKVTGLGAGATAAQISFQPPESTWAANLGLPGLNVYLVDVRENRRLRSNGRDPRPGNGHVVDQPAPMRVDRHYLVSAWSNDSDSSEAAKAEHKLLTEVVAVMGNTPTLIPRQVYSPGDPPTNFPLSLADEALPVTVVPPEGFPKLAEFWGTMPGAVRPWKPVVYLIVTVPVLLDTVFAGREVTELTATYKANTNGDTLIDVGGLVLVKTSGEPVHGAWVQLLAATGPHVQRVETDERGRFRFTRLVAGTYVFRAGAAGVGFDQQTIDIPSAKGEYHLRLA